MYIILYMKLYFILLFLILILCYIIINSKKTNNKIINNFSNINNNFNINKIIYINLDKRTDIKIEIENELKNMSLVNYKRFTAIENRNGALGCSMSHLAVIKKAKKEGYKNVLVLEDDFEFIVNKEQFYNQINKLFQINYDVCLLSYNTPNLYSSEFPFLYKIKDAQTTSGYIINSKYYDKLIEQWEYGVKMFEKTGDDTKYTCDQSWKVLQEKDNWYCFKLRIGKQRKSYSDIQNGITDYNI